MFRREFLQSLVAAIPALSFLKPSDPAITLRGVYSTFPKVHRLDDLPMVLCSAEFDANFRQRYSRKFTLFLRWGETTGAVIKRAAPYLAVPPGFRRESIHFSISRWSRRVDIQVVDIEVVKNA